MSTSFNKKLLKGVSKKGAHPPKNFPDYTDLALKAVDDATKGGAKGFIKKVDGLVDFLVAKSHRVALRNKLMRLINKIGSSPPMKILKPKQAGTFLKPRTGKVQSFGIPADTRRTGGLIEGRGLRHEDGSVEVELAGRIEESIAPLRTKKTVKDHGVSHKEMDYSKDLRSPSALAAKGVGLEGYERAHLWGHGFGDEARAGIMYAPKEFNQIWQNQKLEDKIRVSAAKVRASGGELIVTAKARSYPPMPNIGTKAAKGKGQPLSRKNQEFLLKEISYEVFVKDASGQVKSVARIDFNMPPPGSLDPIVPDIQGVELLERLGNI